MKPFSDKKSDKIYPRKIAVEIFVFILRNKKKSEKKNPKKTFFFEISIFQRWYVFSMEPKAKATQHALTQCL